MTSSGKLGALCGLPDAEHISYRNASDLVRVFPAQLSLEHPGIERYLLVMAHGGLTQAELHH